LTEWYYITKIIYVLIKKVHLEKFIYKVGYSRYISAFNFKCTNVYITLGI